MAVPIRRIIPALVVLLVLFASQAAYAVGSFTRPSGHCAGSAPPSEHCRLPLWLTCCDDPAATAVGASPIGPSAGLALPLATALIPKLVAGDAPMLARVEVPPDTPARRSTILQI